MAFTQQLPAMRMRKEKAPTTQKNSNITIELLHKMVIPLLFIIGIFSSTAIIAAPTEKLDGLPGRIAPNWTLQTEKVSKSLLFTHDTLDLRAALSSQPAGNDSAEQIARKMTAEISKDQRKETSEKYAGIRVTRITILDLRRDEKAEAEDHPTQVSFAFFEYKQKIYILTFIANKSVTAKDFKAQEVLLTRSLLAK